jgi:hypothetical protein
MTTEQPARAYPLRGPHIRNVRQQNKTMPIIIYKTASAKKIASLCDDEWALPPQVDALEAWLKRIKTLPSGDYVADIGFKRRKDASGGGSVLSPEMMRKMAVCRISLFLSEYTGLAHTRSQKKHHTGKR